MFTLISVSIFGLDVHTAIIVSRYEVVDALAYPCASSRCDLRFYRYVLWPPTVPTEGQDCS